jgi:uncharacterized membrane protein
MTLLILLAILIGSFGLLTAAGKLTRSVRIDARRRGQISLALLFVFTGMGHFVQTEQMVEMLPGWVPNRTVIVWASGVFEWLLAVGLLVPRYSRLAGVCAIAFLVLVFPGNVYAAMNRVEMGGHGAGPAYLLVRAPFQLLLIGWAYWFAARGPQRASRSAG